MSRRCFFVDTINPVGDQIIITGPTAHHIQTVLRMHAGDWLQLRDGRGHGWKASIVDAKRGSVRVRLIAGENLSNESPLRLTLAMAFARMDRMDLVIRQATELGIHCFVAYRSGRSQYGLADDQAEKRRQRWLKIAREAMCQCGRMKVPEIHIVSDLQQFIAEQTQEDAGAKSLRLLALEGEKKISINDLRQSFPECSELFAVIGPEGVGDFRAAGYQPVRLGPRILRLETAAIAFITLAQIHWGDFSSLDL
jgi:16S rRNA (uracil1498-N3)-methyltransferase